MKRRLKKALSWFLLLLILSGCGTSPKESETKNPFESLPKNLIIDFDPDSVVEVDKATVITAQMILMDKDITADMFLSKPAEAEMSLEGPGYTYRRKNSTRLEYLCVGLDGEFGTSNRKSNGTVSYSYLDIESRQDVLESIAFGYSSNEVHLRRLAIAPLEGEKELDGITLSEVRKRLEGLLSGLGFPMDTIRPWLTYSMTVEEQRKYYPRLFPLREMLTDQEQEQLADGYALSYRQFFNDIPVVDFIWNGYTSPISHIQTIRGSFCANGLTVINIGSVFQPQSQTEPQPLLSLSEAFEKLKEMYSNIIILKPIRVISAELCYLAGEDASGTIILHPAWMFTTAEESLPGFEDENVFALDAFTGDRLLNAGGFIR
jgi:hypothetical protein